MDKFYFGAHIGTDNLVENAKLVKNSGGNFVQIFLTPVGQKHVSKREKELADLKKFLNENGMKCVVHSSYMHNLAQKWDKYSWWILNLEVEIEYAHKAGAVGIVIHFGKRLLLSLE